MQFPEPTSGHPMVDHRRRLGLDGAQPLVLWVITVFQSRLNQGAPMDSEATGEYAVLMIEKNGKKKQARMAWVHLN